MDIYTLKCEKKAPQTIRRQMLELLRERRRKFPLKEPNCGSVFKSDSDTEVVLAALEEWGIEKSIVKFNGMWAFAWFNFQNGTNLLQYGYSQL